MRRKNRLVKCSREAETDLFDMSALIIARISMAEYYNIAPPTVSNIIRRNSDSVGVTKQNRGRKPKFTGEVYLYFVILQEKTDSNRYISLLPSLKSRPGFESA